MLNRWHPNFDVYVKLGPPSRCIECDKEIRVGQRVITDGHHDFDTCKCEERYRQENGN